MKKTFLFCLFLLVGLCLQPAFAQDAPIPRLKVYSGDAAKAEKDKAASDADVADAKKSAKANTWVVRGDIYGGIAADAKLSSIDAFQIAADAYTKANEIDGGINKNALKGMGELYVAAMQIGTNAYNANDAQSASFAFAAAQKLNPADSVAFLYGAQIAGDLKDKDSAIASIYENSLLGLLSSNFKGDGKIDRATIYSLLASYYVNDIKDFAKAESIVNKGLTEKPGNPMLTSILAEIYLRNDNLDQAINQLKKAIDSDPQNAENYYNVGALYDKADKEAEALEFYDKCLSIKANHQGSLYNSGAIYNNKALIVKKEYDQMDLKESKSENGQAKLNEAKDLWNKALSYFEKLYSDNTLTDKKTVLKALRNVYAGLGRSEDVDRVKKELGEE